MPRNPLRSRTGLPRIVAALVFIAVCGPAAAGPVRSVGAMTFVDADTVVIAD